MIQKSLKSLTRDLRRMHQRAERGMIYSFSGGKSISGKEFFENLAKECNTRNEWPMFEPLSDFDYTQGYQILRGYNSTIVKIFDIQGKTIVKEKRPNKDFKGGEIVIMTTPAPMFSTSYELSGLKAKILETGSNSLGIIWKHKYYADSQIKKVPVGNYWMEEKYLQPFSLVVKEAEVKKTNFMLKVFRDLSVRVYPTERGLYGEKISLEEALKEERLRDGVEGFLDVWRKDFDKFEIKPYEGGK